MNISIFGLGYVGCISLGCLAENGHRVIGVDVNRDKVDLVNSGKSTVIEKDIDDLIKRNFEARKISATVNHEKAVLGSDVSIICVGTPSAETGHLDLVHVYDVSTQIGAAVKIKEDFHTVLIRSTVPPGTNDSVCDIIEKQSGKRRNVHFAVVTNPEFLREGTSVSDYFHPSFTVIASESRKGLDDARALYKSIKAPIIEMEVREAEILKYIFNSFHALKVCFANEVGNICKRVGIDSHRVMKVFFRDKKLNISPYYLKPGFAYGGTCLPKDLKALTMIAHDHYLKLPLLNSIEESNRQQIELARQIIIKNGRKKIGFLGLSFKPGTDDLRFSPILEVIEPLLGKGYQIAIYDRNVHLSNLTGVNKAFIQGKLPHIEKILKSALREVIEWAEVVVIVNNEKEFRKVNFRPEQTVIDLVRIRELEKNKNYNGICW